MNITINLLEVASELAHHATMLELSEVYDEETIWALDKQDETYRYPEDVQDIFNGWYDFYYNLIESYKIN